MAALDQFLKIIVEQGGSDLHIGEGQPPKMRKHGDVAPIRDAVLSHDETMSMLKEVCGDRNWKIFDERGDLDFAYEMDAASRFRCNYLKQAHGFGAVFRLIPTKIASLEQLGIPLVAKEFAHLRGGLVLVTGPTGSGKSTTLAALIDYINENFSRHIVTIEEPIEFVHDNKRSIITQREVPNDSESFPIALKAALREDADIVLVGEMRDLETVSLALTAAETGLLVFGTLHTNNARKTVDRMVDVFPAARQPQARATQKLQDVIVSGKGQGMQFMDDAIFGLLEKKIVSPHEAFMKAIDKNRFKQFLPAEDAHLGDAAGSVPDDEKRLPGNFMKRAATQGASKPTRR